MNREEILEFNKANHPSAQAELTELIPVEPRTLSILAISTSMAIAGLSLAFWLVRRGR